MEHYTDEQSTVGKWLKYTFGLAYLPPSEVEEGFCDLMTIVWAEVTTYADYLTDSYIEPTTNMDKPPYICAANDERPRNRFIARSIKSSTTLIPQFML